jgi:excisionase family DNA binding protein
MIDLSTWLNKTEAAARLGISERTLDRLAAEDKGPERRLRPRPGKKPEPVFNPDDVAEMAPKEQTHVVRFAAPSPAAEPTPVFPVTLAIAALERIADRVVPRIPPQAKPFLTVAEAASYSGLSESYLRRMVREGRMPYVRDRGYKIRRADLDSFAGVSVLAELPPSPWARAAVAGPFDSDT